jgi:phosphotriesterase-related protein
VRTVLGDVEPSALGATYCHEHFFCRPGDERQPGFEDLVLDDTERSAEELRIFRRAGGSTVVDVTTSEYGRDAARLAEISRRTGVNVVAATGHIMEALWDGVEDVAERSDGDLVAEMVRDLTEGLPGAPGVRAGVIKVGTSKDGPTRDEERVLRAAVEAQRRTGAPITTHTTKGTAPLEQLRIFQDAGADLGHVIIGHQDHRLDWHDHLAIVEAGCYIGYDCISKEQYVPDAERIAFIARLIEAGHGDRICLSGDLARRTYLTAYGGGPGMSYVLWRFLPWLRQRGVSEDDARGLVVDNPARLLAWNGAS